MKKPKLVVLITVLFLLVASGTTLGVQFFTKTGLFRIPGVVIYDESLNETEIETLKAVFTEDIDLDKNVTISAIESLQKLEEKPGQFLANIYVPVTDFYSTKSSISSETNFIDGKIAECNCGVSWCRSSGQNRSRFR